MLVNYKFEIYPNEEQIDTLNHWLNICRQTYNSALLDKKRAYRTHKYNLKRKELQTILKQNKKQYPFLKEVPSQPLQEVLFRLDKAYQKFFRKEAKYPKIKSEKDYHSLTFTQFGMTRQREVNKKTGKVKHNLVRKAASFGRKRHLCISKLGEVRVNWHRDLKGVQKIKQVIIKRQNNKWFAVFCVDVKNNQTKKIYDETNSVGLDVGIKSFVVLSNGDEIANPHYLRKAEKRLKRYQKKYSKSKQKSKNNQKRLKKLQALHTKVANQRRDFLHQLTTILAKQYAFLAMEDLKIRNMVKNKRLAKSIHDAGWGQFKTLLTYKCERYGATLECVDPKWTTQDCSTCGTRVKKSLSVRTHICSKCGLILDRDHNAAINILKRAMRSVTPCS